MPPRSRGISKRMTQLAASRSRATAPKAKASRSISPTPKATASSSRGRWAGSPTADAPDRAGLLRHIAHALAQTSIEPGHDPARPRHVGPIVLAEGLDHHPFLAPDSTEEQNPEGGEAGRTGNPVRQEQCLRHRVEPERRVDRMPDAPVDAAGHQDMAFAQLQSCRKVPSKIAMRAVQQPQREPECRGSEPARG